MKETANFGLKKPEETDFYSVDTQNDNMDAIDSVLQEFKDGTRQVGDSAKLGGKDASEYALSKNFYAGDNYAFIQSEPTISVDGYTYRLIGGYDGIKVIRTKDNWSTVEIYTDLANYLPLAGGKVSKASGSPLQIENTVTDICTIDMFGANKHLGSLGFHRANTPVMINTEGEVINLLHTGNKPTGTYIGNGSETARVIATGGIGSVCVIYSSLGYRIITDIGGFNPADGTISNEASFTNGTLYVASTSTYLNASGVEYRYANL